MSMAKRRWAVVAALILTLPALCYWSLKTESLPTAILGVCVTAVILALSRSGGWRRRRAELRRQEFVQALTVVLYEENPDTHPHSMEMFMTARQQAEDVAERMGW